MSIQQCGIPTNFPYSSRESMYNLHMLCLATVVSRQGEEGWPRLTENFLLVEKFIPQTQKWGLIIPILKQN